MQDISKQWKRPQSASRRRPTSRRLSRLENFGSNPGNLAGWMRVPADPSKRPLVVVLHGCTQDAAGFDAGTGWSRLADLYGFAVLFPEQERENNPNLCFNWFEPGDIARGKGEVASIIQMVDAAIERHGLSGSNVFVTGLSAGGAMASALLATYPERFSGGAIIAGLPFGGAAGVPQAWERMRARRLDPPGALEALVRDASHHRGPWPSLSIWQGSEDQVVSPRNAEAILDQWLGLHGLAAKPTRIEAVNGYPRRTWTDASGKDVVEAYSITGMGHGAPIGRSGASEYGVPGAHIFETEISSTLAIASFWDLIGELPAQSSSTSVPADSDSVYFRPQYSGPILSHTQLKGASPSADIQTVIENALRAAGLMK